MGNSIELVNVRKSFGKSEILRGIDLEVKEGEIFGLLGPSGCGKTTTVKLIAGISKPSVGTVSVLRTRMPNRQILEEIGYMAQAAALYPTMSAYANLKFFGKLYANTKGVLQDRIEYVSNLVGLTDQLDKQVSTYSGGMKQRLSLAIALIGNPKLLVLDEPTVGIDPVLRARIWNELNKLSESGVTILITTHVMDEASKCTRLAMMRGGIIIANGKPHDLIEQSGKSTIEDAFIYFGGDEDEN